MMTTAATPMMMPSMVRKERIFLETMDLTAILKACFKFMQRPPLCRRRR